ncbi:MAG: acetoacetate decarboxylase family protein [Deltaproteobacteria bacterium]|nr:acetoacetate decarboxylase family protein [Deltaproteobacteria bacterium]
MAEKPASRPTPDAYSMPALSGLYGKPPFEYRDAKQMTVQFRTDPAVLRDLVPPPLTPNEDATVFVSSAEFLSSGFGRYLEAHVFTHATFEDRLVNFSLYLVLDSDVAIGAGREIWGFPKKLGRLTLDMKDDVVRTTVERGGCTIIEAAVHLAELGSEEDLGGTPEWVAHRFIPNVSLSAPPDIDQLTSTTLTNVVTHDVYTGGATLAFGSSPADRLEVIPIHEITGGSYINYRFTLGDGKVIHDYLA